MPNAELFTALQSAEQGLSQDQAEERLLQYGPNEIGKDKARSGVRVFLAQFRSPLVMLLIGASVLAGFLQDFTDAIIILCILFLNGILGFTQEYKSEKVLEQLKKYISFKAKTMREGRIIEVDNRNLVVGDVVLLETGDLIPADLRLFKAEELYINEASLTGESYPVHKISTEIMSESPSITEMKNIAFMGTYVKGGEGLGILIASAKETYFGKTVHLLKVIKKESDFQRSLGRFSSTLVKIILLGVILIFFVNALIIQDILATFLFSLALAVGMVPEALPMIVTIALSNGALQLAKKQVVVKRLVSVEDFGNIDVVCTDKTGTITENKLTLSYILNIAGESNGDLEDRLMLYSLLCNSIKEMKMMGNPLDLAIWDYAKQHFDTKRLEDYPIIRETPFDSTRKRMSVVVKTNETLLCIVKGTPEMVIGLSTHFWEEEEIKLLEDREAAAQVYEKYGSEGYRVIAVAYKEIEETALEPQIDEAGLTLLGFLMFMDPPKESAREAFELSKRLGVAIKILTGDGPYVSKEIAHQVGLDVNDEEIVLGEKLDHLTDDELTRAIDSITIISRATPEHKYRVVKALREHGHVVGCLGDGVNDAPALKEADVGISVDQGADIAKDAADIILLDKSLKVIVNGIEQGRKTFNNIVKYLIYTMAGNFGDLYTIGVASSALKFLALSPTQVIMANFLTDMPTLAISTDTVEKEAVIRPGRWNVNQIFKYGSLLGVIDSCFDIILILLLTLVFKVDQYLFMTALFLYVVLSEIFGFYAIRSEKFFLRSTMPSKKLILASIFIAILSFMLIYLPSNVIFGFSFMPVKIVLTIIGIGIAFMFAIEVFKVFYFKKLIKPKYAHEHHKKD